MRNRLNKGFTIVELMLATVIFLIVAVGLGQAMSAILNSYHKNYDATQAYYHGRSFASYLHEKYPTETVVEIRTQETENTLSELPEITWALSYQSEDEVSDLMYRRLLIVEYPGGSFNFDF